MVIATINLGIKCQNKILCASIKIFKVFKCYEIETSFNETVNYIILKIAFHISYLYVKRNLLAFSNIVKRVNGRFS